MRPTQADDAFSSFERAADGVLTVDDAGVCVDANSAACALYQRTYGELVGARIGSFDEPSREEHWQRLLGGEESSVEVDVRRLDGTSCSVEISYLGAFAPGKHLLVVRDISDRLPERLALELVEHLPIGTYILSFTDDVQTYISPVSAKMLGYPADAWSDPDFLASTIHPDHREELLENIGRMLAGEIDTDAREYRLVAADGRSVWVYGAVDMIRAPDGTALYQRGYQVDITHRKELEEQLHASQRMETIGRLAGGIAHDFNNLLTAITGYGNFALERIGETDPRLRQDVDQIVRAAERAAALTQQLLAFSRRQVLQPRTLDLNVVVADVRGLLERLLGEHVELVTQCGDDPLRVCADPGRLEQVLVNLAVNAQDAMPGGGTLTIAATELEVDASNAIVAWGAEPGSYPALVISDTGSGMDEETLAHVFEPFFTTKEFGASSGLGLSTVYGIVKQSGGWIWLESVEGGGTTATIYLPPSVQPSLVEAPAPPAAAAGSGRILLVEDEDVVRMLVAEMLEQHGYDVVEAPGPLEALELAHATAADCDLLLTDVVMPKMNGRELARRIRERAPELHVVYTSGYAPEAVLDGGRLDAGEYFLQKPFTATDLTAIVGEALDAASAAAA